MDEMKKMIEEDIVDIDIKPANWTSKDISMNIKLYGEYELQIELQKIYQDKY